MRSGIATDGQIWYSSYYRDVMGKLDRETGKVIEYPMPYADNGMRDFFVDARTGACGTPRRPTTGSAISTSPTGSAAPTRAERRCSARSHASSRRDSQEFRRE